MLCQCADLLSSTIPLFHQFSRYIIYAVVVLWFPYTQQSLMQEQYDFFTKSAIHFCIFIFWVFIQHFLMWIGYGYDFAFVSHFIAYLFLFEKKYTHFALIKFSNHKVPKLLQTFSTKHLFEKPEWDIYIFFYIYYISYALKLN